jgi:hypothetical protein
MINVDLKGLISGIIAVVKVSIQLYEAVDDVSGLPEPFRDVAVRLPIIQNTLEEALRWLAEEEQNACEMSEEQYIMLYGMLENCRNKATAIQIILQSVNPDVNTSFVKRCKMAVKAIAHTKRVEGLMQAILEDFQVLATNRAFHTISKPQFKSVLLSN